MEHKTLTTQHSQKQLLVLFVTVAAILLFLIALVGYAVRSQSIYSESSIGNPKAVESVGKPQ